MSAISVARCHGHCYAIACLKVRCVGLTYQQAQCRNAEATSTQDRKEVRGPLCAKQMRGKRYFPATLPFAVAACCIDRTYITTCQRRSTGISAP